MTPSSSLDFPSLTEIQEIAAETDAVLRNLRITNAYYRLNRAMGAVVGTSDLTWCGYAVWASKTAGEYIRQGEVPAIIEDWIDKSTGRAGSATTLVAHALGIHSEQPGEEEQAGTFSLRGFASEIIAGVGSAIGTGNQIVFENVTPPFSRLLSLWSTYGGAIPDAEKQQFLESLRGQQLPADYLYHAFAAMFDAAQAPGSPASAQSLCYANALVGCVEQTAVQPYIASSMKTPVADLFLQKLDVHLHSRFSTLVAEGLKEALKPLAAALEVEFDRLCTEWVMRLNLPDQALRLGLDVPPLPDEKMYPEELAELELAALVETLTELDALEALGSGAKDWTQYPQRMRYICVLFRSRQRMEILFGPPFTDAQIAILKQGQVPAGPL